MFTSRVVQSSSGRSLGLGDVECPVVAFNVAVVEDQLLARPDVACGGEAGEDAGTWPRCHVGLRRVVHVCVRWWRKQRPRVRAGGDGECGG